MQYVNRENSVLYIFFVDFLYSSQYWRRRILGRQCPRECRLVPSRMCGRDPKQTQWGQAMWVCTHKYTPAHTFNMFSFTDIATYRSSPPKTDISVTI